ncbi:hypothetical protein DID88_001635 [Monilinia fructigena]|uniref:Uncharacterized protein n=1 Tax=Monilinia fructigena TaxID=38457 RepID=A0A395IWH4_9HELO|nr:hypothetical protein DID88_001635 [Monilinia fructigena]
MRLHGGVKGWGKRFWQGPKLVGKREIPGVEGLEGGESVEFRLRDEDGEEGYPGTLDVSVVYTTGKQKLGGKEIRVLGIEYEVKLVDDGKGVEETVVNVTKSFFTLGPEEPNVDDCFIVDAKSESTPLDTRSSSLTTLVKASHPETGIHLEVLSTEPAFQFYTGKYIDVPAVEGLEARGARSGFCVEPSRYVNAN